MMNLIIVTIMPLSVTMETVYLLMMSVMEAMTVETTVTKKIAVINEYMYIHLCSDCMSIRFLYFIVSIVGPSPT